MAMKRSASRLGTLPGGGDASCWIEEKFHLCECMYFIPVSSGSDRCGCGRDRASHNSSATFLAGGLWKWRKHTGVYPTDSYGTIRFRTGIHASYIRMSPLTRTNDVVRLLVEQCGAHPPKLIVSIHSSLRDFDMDPDVKRSFRRSIQRMANVPGCWIITTGLDVGGAKYIGDSLTAGIFRKTQAIVIGIVPWGVIADRQQLCERNSDVQYYATLSLPGANRLNPNHSVFLLVDDGSVGKYGHEVKWRLDFEKQISSRIGGEPGVPLIALFLEGGAYCLQLAVDYLAKQQPIVAVGGSGRTADLLTKTVAMASNDPEFHPQALLSNIESVYPSYDSKMLIDQLSFCIQQQSLVTAWQTIPTDLPSCQNFETETNLDVCILRVLLKAKNRTLKEQFKLSLAWNRVDLAAKEVLNKVQEWPNGDLEEMMMEALSMGRVGFVELLLEHVSMESVLTYHRLESLYNVTSSETWLLKEMIGFLAKRRIGNRITLEDVGATLTILLGNNYRSSYKSRSRLLFRDRKESVKKKDSLSSLVSDRSAIAIPGGNPERFSYPFSELLIWAVLMQRPDMAMLMCVHGKETLAKSCVGYGLVKAMASFLKSRSAAHLETTIAKLKQSKKDYATLAIDLLDRCNKTDEIMAQQLLAYELCNFGNKTCLSLAASAQLKQLVSHPCSQKMIDMLWMGGLRWRSTKPWMILLGLLCPPFAVIGLDYLSLDELRMQPQIEADEERSHGLGNSLTPSRSALKQARDELLRKTNLTIPAGLSYSNSITSQDGGICRTRSYSISVDEGQPQQLEAPTTTKPTPRSIKQRNIGSAKRRSVILSMENYNAPDASAKLAPLERMNEFYNAPVTKYWIHVIGYFIFLLCYCYTILTETYLYSPQWEEVYCWLYVFGLLWDTIRRVLSIEAYTFLSRLRLHFQYTWNIFDAIGIVLFHFGFLLRWSPASFEVGRALWIVAIAFFIVHFLDICQAYNELATYVMMMGKMLQRMVSFMIILGVVVAMYGIILQAARFPFRHPEWDILKDIWIEPFLNLFGETYHEFVDTRQCDSENKYTVDRTRPPCWCCGWIGPVAQAAFLIVANILMLSLLVAVFNAVFEKVNRKSKMLIRFQRYKQIIDFKMQPVLPPPFILIPQLVALFRTLFNLIRGNKKPHGDAGLLKLVLNPRNLISLHDFEEQAKDELIEKKQTTVTEEANMSKRQLQTMQESLEAISQSHADLMERLRLFETKASSPKAPCLLV